MDKSLERHNLPRLNQEETENMNRPITGTEIENSDEKLPTNRSLGPDGSQANSTKHSEKS